MLKFHPRHKYLGFLLLAASACDSDQGVEGVNIDAGADSGSAGTAPEGTEVSGEQTSGGPVTTERGTIDVTLGSDSETDSETEIASTNGDTFSSTSASSSGPLIPSSDPSSLDSASTGVPSSETPSSGTGGEGTTYEPPVGSSDTGVVDTSTAPATDQSTVDPSSNPPIDTSGAQSSGDGGVSSGVNSGDVVDSGGPGIVFEDDFDGETIPNGKYEFNYTGFDQWNVIGGTVDLIAFPNELLESPGGYGEGQPANGVTVDLNGSNLHDGVIETKQEFTFWAGVTYELRYSLGSPYAETNGVTVEVLGVFSKEDAQTGILPFDGNTETFTPVTTTTAKLRFTSLGNDDNVGLVLDEVTLERLP